MAIDHSLAPPATAHPPATAELSPQRVRALARAAQLDVLRRLTPPLRHDMVVHLQSLGMGTEALAARLDRGSVPAHDVQAAISKLNRLARQAIASCLGVCTWMEAGEDDTTLLREGAGEVVRLLSTSLDFRGFALRSELGEGDIEVSRSAVRFLLAGAILALADAAPGPGELVVRTEQASTHGVIAVEYRPQPDAASTQPHESGETPLAWPELQALATVHDVELLRKGEAVILRLPRAVVTRPLKMAPV